MVAQQERLRLAARRGQVDVGVVEALAVVVVGNADGIIACLLYTSRAAADTALRKKCIIFA